MLTETNHNPMKKIYLRIYFPAALLIGLVAILSYGCGKKESTVAGPGQPVVSAEKTSFNEVTSQLDPGGNFYLYLGTAQWLDNLSGKIGAWRQTFLEMPNLKPEDAANVGKAFDIVTGLIKDSGIEDVSGVGMSSVEIEKGVFRNKAVLHHYPGKGTGFLWQLAGGGPHPLTGLDFLPSDTALAVFSDCNLPVLWTAAQKEISHADLPQAQEWLNKLPAQFEQKTQVKWDAFLNSLGGEFGLVITLDSSNNLSVPLPGGATQIPSPGILLAAKVNDDTIFNRIDTALKSNSQVISVDKPGLKMRTMPVPLPFLGELRPSAASSGGYLFIATSDALVDQALAVKSGQQPGLKSTDEFKHLSAGLPDQGNQFCYMSGRFAETLMQVQQRVMAASAKSDARTAQWMQSLFHNRPAFVYSVSVNTPEGCVSIANGSQSYANTALMMPAAIVGAMSAIAIPNFVKARETAQRNACINNLRMIDGAKQEWALEKGKQATDVPTWDDLKPYLREIPRCPAGGTYTINAVGTPPQCSVPGHVLPQ